MMGEDPGQDTTDNLHDDLVSSIAATGGCTSARTGLYLDYHELQWVMSAASISTSREAQRIMEKIGPSMAASEASHRIFKEIGTCVEDM